MANSESSNANAYFLAEYSLDGGENWSTLVSNQSVAPGTSERGSVNVPSGQNVRWRYKTSTTPNSFSGGWKRWGPSFTVDCPTPTTTIGPVSTTTTTIPTNPTDPEACLLSRVSIINVQNLLDCIDNNKPDPTDPDPTDPDPTDPDPTDPDPTDPLVDDFCEDMVLEEDDICEAPLTDESGNDFLEWDDDDDISVSYTHLTLPTILSV